MKGMWKGLGSTKAINAVSRRDAGNAACPPSCPPKLYAKEEARRATAEEKLESGLMRICNKGVVFHH